MILDGNYLPNKGSTVRRLWKPHNPNHNSKMVLPTVNLGPPKRTRTT